MAEPAYQLDEDAQDEVYDEPSGTAPSSPQPDLKVLEGRGETSEPKRGHLKEADGAEPSREGLAKAEQDTSTDEPHHDNLVGSGYTPSAPKKPFLARLASTQSRKLLIGGGIGALITAVSIALFLALLPLKIDHIVNNLQSHFFATSENAAQRETDSLFSGYVKRVILCPTVKSSVGCSFVCNTNPVSCLWRSWHNAKLEDKLLTDYGIEFKKVGGNFYLKAPGLNGNGLNIDEFVNNNSGETLDEFIANSKSGEFVNVNRSELRQALRNSVSGETRWKQTMYRFKIGRLLEEKYGIRRCIIFCGTKDALADSVQAQKNAAKLYLVERVIQPRDQSLAIVLECFFDSSCHPTETQPTATTTVPCQADVDCELNGAPENIKTDTAIRTSLEDLATTYGVEDASQLTALYSEIESKGFDNFLIQYVMKNVFGVEVSDATAESLSKAIPIIGWLNMAFQLVNFSHQAPTKLKKLSYLTNAAAVVSLYAMYRTYVDEKKTGKVNATEVGSLVSSLGPVASSADFTDLKGGTASAEQTPLYSNLIGDRSGTGSSKYVCTNNQPPAGGSGTNLICPEEKLAVDSAFFDGLKNFVDSSGLSYLAGFWNATIGQIFSAFNSLITLIFSHLASTFDTIYCATIPYTGIYVFPWAQPYCEARSLIADATKKIISFATSQLFPSPVSENMSGGRTFDLMAAGADVSGNDYAHNGLGGQKLTDQQTAAIVAVQDQQAAEAFNHQSFIARMFDTNSNYSLVNKLAMAMPDSVSNFQTTLASFFSNPFGKLSHGIATMFNPGQVFAAASAQPDPFGVTQYGYPLDDPKLAAANKDPQAYWDNNCADGTQTQAWNQDASSTANIDPNTGMPMNTYTDPCLIIKSITGSDGGLFDSSLLTQDDLNSQ